MKNRIGLAIALALFGALLVKDAIAISRIIVVAGAGGEEKYKQAFIEQATALRTTLITKYGYAPDQITLLAEEVLKEKEIRLKSDAATIRDTFAQFAKTVKQDEALIIFFIGHGTFDGEWAKFNIPGPDLRDIDYAALLENMSAGKVVIINFASASGPFVEKLSGDNRIVVTATRSGIERNATHFAEHFIQALQEPQSTDLNKDGKLSVSEAFVSARDRLVNYYAEKRQLRPEHPLLEDNGDGVGTETPDLLTGDGARAGSFYLQQTEQLFSSGQQARSKEDSNRLSARHKKILARVKALQKRKEQMPEKEYYEEFEKLMLELARLNTAQAPQDTVPQKRK